MAGRTLQSSQACDDALALSRVLLRGRVPLLHAADCVPVLACADDSPPGKKQATPAAPACAGTQRVHELPAQAHDVSVVLPAHTQEVSVDTSTRGGGPTRGRDEDFRCHFSAVYGAFIVFALISNLPRGLALLALSTRVSVSLREVFEEKVGFGDLMAGCKASNQVWTGLSPQFHKDMIMADYSLKYVGAFLAFLASACCLFQDSSRKMQLVKGFFVTLAACNVAVNIHSVERSLLVQNLHSATSGPVQNARLYNWILFAISIAGVCVSILLKTSCSTSDNLQDFRKLRCSTSRIRQVFGKLLVGLVIALIFLFCFMVNGIQRDLLGLFGNKAKSEWQHNCISTIPPYVLGNLVLIILRIVTTANQDSIPLNLALMLSFMGKSFASFAARRFINNTQDPIMLVLNCALISAVEILAWRITFWNRMILRGMVMQHAHISKLTIGELFQLNDRIVYEINANNAHMLINQVCEIVVLFTIAVQYLCAPEWVEIRTPDYHFRFYQIFLTLSVQISFDVVVAFFIMRSYYRASGAPVPFRELSTRLLWHRHLILFCIGIMIYHSLTFSPKCTTCKQPILCLLFIECGRGQTVTIGTQNNACLQYRGVNNYAHSELLQVHNNQRIKYGLTRNLTLEDLGCARQDVQCVNTLAPKVNCNQVECEAPPETSSSLALSVS
jgi:hypothetical protein